MVLVLVSDSKFRIHGIVFTGDNRYMKFVVRPLTSNQEEFLVEAVASDGKDSGLIAAFRFKASAQELADILNKLASL